MNTTRWRLYIFFSTYLARYITISPSLSTVSALSLSSFFEMGPLFFIRQKNFTLWYSVVRWHLWHHCRTEAELPLAALVCVFSAYQESGGIAWLCFDNSVASVERENISLARHHARIQNVCLYCIYRPETTLKTWHRAVQDPWAGPAVQGWQEGREQSWILFVCMFVWLRIGCGKVTTIQMATRAPLLLQNIFIFSVQIWNTALFFFFCHIHISCSPHLLLRIQ